MHSKFHKLLSVVLTLAIVVTTCVFAGSTAVNAAAVTPSLAQGTIDKGTIHSSVTTRVYTKDMLAIADYTSVTIASGYKAMYHLYDANGTWLANNGTWVNGAGAAIFTTAQMLSTSSTAVSFRIVIAPTGSGNVTPSSAASSITLAARATSTTPTLAQGTIDKGTIHSSVTTRVYTEDLLAISDFTGVKLASGYKAIYHLYNANGTWIAANSGWVNGAGAQIFTTAQMLSTSGSAVYFRIVVAPTDSRNVTPDSAKNALTLTAPSAPVRVEMAQGTIDKGAVHSHVTTRAYTKDLLAIADYTEVKLNSGYKAMYHLYDANGTWLANNGTWVNGAGTSIFTTAQMLTTSSIAVSFKIVVAPTGSGDITTDAAKAALSFIVSDTAGSGDSSSSSSSSSSSTTLDPDRTSLTLSASGAKGPETVISTSPISASEFVKPTFTKTKDSSTGLEYYYYKPSTAAPADGYPILLWLHGTNQSGDPFTSLNFWWSHNADILRNAVIIAPLWTGGLYQLSLDKYWSTSGNAVTLVKKIVSNSTYGKIDANRVYIAGYSAGGIGTFREVAKNDGYFAAAAPFAGSAKSATMNDSTLKTTPMWAWHGSNDTTVDYNANGALLLGYASKAIYNKIGSSSLMRFTTINGAVHAGAPYSASKDRRLWSWMFQQKKGSVQTRDYTVEGYIKVVDANGNTVISELDCSGTPAYDSSAKQFTLTLTDAARTKLTNAYTSSGGKEFTVYYGNQKILTYTATTAVDSSMTKFVIKNAFSSSYSDDNIINRIGSAINVNKLSKTAYSETVN